MAIKKGLAVTVNPKMLTSHQVISGLRSVFPANCFALIEQVANSTGFGVKGWADAVIVGLWPSRGVDIIGVEVKVSRSDWKRELENGRKAENIARFCDLWYVAVGNESIIQDGELPQPWGLIVPKSATDMKVLKTPERNTTPQFDRGFLAAVLRRVSEQRDAALKVEFERGQAKERERQRETVTADDPAVRLKLSEYERLRKVTEAFQQASGVDLFHEWNGGLVGEIVRVLRHKGIKTTLEEVTNVRASVRHALDSMDKSLQELNGSLLSRDGSW